MKQWIYKPMLILCLIGLLSPFAFANGRKDFTKTIKKEFDISSNGEVGLSNKFGKIEVNTWDKNSVKIAVTIIVKADSEDEAQDVFDRIDIDFSNGSDYVKAETNIQPQRSNWWGWSNSHSDFAINYDVFMPRNVKLDLRNKHGDTYIAELSGSAEIDIAHGDLSADGFDGNVDLEMAHSNGTVLSARDLEADLAHSKIRFNKLDDVSIESAHCKIDIGEAKKVRLESRHTNFEIGNIEELRVDSRHGVFEIDFINTIFSEAEHTNFRIEKVGRTADLDCSHGGVSIDHLEKGFEEVLLVGAHTSYKIGLADGVAYQLDASGTHSGISYPMDMDITYEKDKNYVREVKGSKGSGSKGLIKARLSHGGLRIR